MKDKKDGSSLIAAFQMSPAQTVLWSHHRPNYSPDILAGINICKWAAGLHYHTLLLAQYEPYSLSDVQTDASHVAVGGLDVSLSGLLKYSHPADIKNLKNTDNDIPVAMLELVVLMGPNVIQSGLV